MHLAGDINDFAGRLTETQLGVVKNFLSGDLDWAGITHGEKRTLDEQISVVFLAAEGTEQWTNVLEAHCRFYDLHCTVEGNDIIVSKPVSQCKNIRTPYNGEADYILYNETPEQSIEVLAGNYCLIPPADAHMALYGQCGFVKKLVFKIPVL